ncbi:MAG: hypothetical protein AAGA20_22500, partial [Planctomycetota bacterium]
APPAVAAVVCALALTLLGLGRRETRLADLTTERSEPELVRVDRRGDAPEVQLAKVGNAPAERSFEVTPEPAPKPDDAAETRVDPGTVTVRFVDAQSGEPVDGVELRGATENRFVTFEASAEHEMTLTPGTWEFAARRAPYEYVSLDPIVVEEGAAIDAGIVELVRGWGSITGQVDVPARVAATGPFEVRLFGAGRSPCAGVERDEDGRCIHCGHSEENTTRRVAAMELFQIDGLAAGQYSALVYDAKGRILFNLHVALETGEAVRLDLRMDFVDVDFRISDASGQPFTRVWEEEGTTFEGPIEFYFGADGSACATASTEARSSMALVLGEDGAARFEERTDRVFLRDPKVIARERTAQISASRILSSSVRSDVVWKSVEVSELLHKAQAEGLLGDPAHISQAPPRPEPQDWPRTEDEDVPFAAWTVEPQVETRPLKARQIAEGLFRVEQVPVQADRVLVTCGPFYESVTFDLGAHRGIPIEVTLEKRCNAPSDMFVGAQSCFECHNAGAVAAMSW